MTALIASSAENSQTSGASLDIGKPAGLSVGDLIVIIVGNDNSTTTDQWDNSTLKPTGFTLINETGDGTSDSHAAAFWKVADAGDVAGSGWSVPVQSSNDMWGFALRVTGADASDPINGVGSDISDGTPPISITGFNTDVADCLGIAVFCFDGGDGPTFTIGGTGWSLGDEITTAAGNGSAGSGGYAVKTVTSAGPSGTCTASGAVGDGMGGFQFAINPSTGPTIASVDSDYGAASDEFDVDEDSLAINGTDLGTADVYLSADSTLAGGSTEIDISAAIQSNDGSTINLDLTSLTTEHADIDALLASDGHALSIIVDASGGEVSRAVTVHRAKAFNMAASTHITASGEDTTAQLTAPSGKTTGDFGGGRIQDDENPGDAVDIATDEYREDEWSIAGVDPSDGTYLGAQDGETYQFRVVQSDGTVLGTYTETPAWTIGTGVESNSGGSTADLEASAEGAGVKVSGGAATASLDVDGLGAGAKAASGGATAGLTLGAEGTGLKVGTSGATADLTIATEGAGVASRAGSGIASVDVTATGDGTKAAIGSAGSGIAVDTEGAGVKAGQGSATAGLTVTATGAGSAAEVHTGGATAALSVSSEGDGAKATIGSDTANLTVDALADGFKTGIGSGTSDLTVGDEGDGTAGHQSGAEAQLSVTTTGDGTKHGQSGSTANVEVDAEGGGLNPAGPPQGGSTSTVTVTTTGDGSKATTGGASGQVTVDASGAGLKNGQGGSEADLEVSATGGNLATSADPIFIEIGPLSLGALAGGQTTDWQAGLPVDQWSSSQAGAGWATGTLTRDWPQG